MPSFGEKLRKEREKRKISLDEISSTTKIGTRMLQALEEDKFNLLPGGIFNKGFVRAYARAVGLDEDQTVADYLVASGDAPIIRPDAQSRESQRGPRDTAREESAPPSPLRITDDPNGRLEIRAEAASRQLPWGIFAAVLLIVALGLTLWNHRRLQQHSERPTASSTSAAPPGESAPEPSSSPSSSTPSPAAALPSSDSPQAAAAPTTVSHSQPVSTANQQQSTTPAPGQFTVQITAREDSWLSVVADDQHSPPELLTAGKQTVVHAHRSVVVKAGNSGGVDILLNGTQLAFGGDYAVPKTVTIGPAGIVPNAPAPPSNP